MKPPLVGFRRKRRHNAETREEREVLRCTNIGKQLIEIDFVQRTVKARAMSSAYAKT